MEIFFIIFFVLTVLFFLSNKEDTGPIKVLKSIWYTVATIGSVAIILVSICLIFIKYQELEDNNRKISYQEYNQCMERAKHISSFNNFTLDTSVYIEGCVKPSGY